MTIDIWNDFKAGGFVMGVYTFLRALDTITALVLCQLISEYNHAYNNNLNYYDDFLCKPKRIIDFLGITYEELITALDELEDKNFLFYDNAYIEDTFIIMLFPSEIIKFKKDMERKYFFKAWDDGLISSQNPMYKTTNFETSTYNIKKFIDEHTKNPNAIPIIAYSSLNSYIRDYEKNGKNICEISDIKECVYNILSKNNFNQYVFEELICIIDKLV